MKISLMHEVGLSFGQVRDEIYIGDALARLGVDVLHNQVLPDTDLVLAFKTRCYGVEHIDQWRVITKAPIWIWTFDNMDRFSWFYPFIKKCDLWLGEELGRKARWEQEGLPFYYFPYHAVPPEVFRPIHTPKQYEYDVVFTGTPYGGQYDPDKFGLLKAVDDRFDLHIFGNEMAGWKSRGFKNVHEAQFDEKLAEVYDKAKIVLAISNVQCEGYWSIRTSQALMCGACVLTRFTPQMEKELKDNVVYFQTIDDCLEKINYYLYGNKKTNQESNQKAVEEDRRKKEIKSRIFAEMNLSVIQRMKELLILYENRNSITTPA